MSKMNESVNHHDTQENAAASSRQSQTQGLGHAQLQRRQLLKAAMVAAPMLVTLRARSVYGQSGLGSTGINYGDYLNGGDAIDPNNTATNIPEPGAPKKKKKFFYWW